MHTPHFPPFFAQCLQYLQFLHALQFFEPVQVALCLDLGLGVANDKLERTRVENETKSTSENILFIHI